MAVKEQRILSPSKKNIGLQVFSTAALKFGESLRKF